MIILLWIFLSSSPVFGVTTIDIQSDFSGKTLDQETYWYRGDEEIHRIQEESFQKNFKKVETDENNQGFDQNTYWYRIGFTNSTSHKRQLFLHDTTNLREEFVIYDGTNSTTLTKKITVDKRIVGIEIAAGTTKFIFLKVKSFHIPQVITWKFWNSKEEIQQHVSRIDRNFFVLEAVFFMSIFFNAILFYANREKSYLYYIVHLISFGIFSAQVFALFYIPFFTERGGVFFANLSSSAIWLFAIEFLRVNHKSLSYKISMGMAILYGVGLPLSLFISVERFYAIVAAIGSCAILVIAITIYIKTLYQHVLIFLLAHGFAFAVGLVQMLGWLGNFGISNYLMLYAVGGNNALMLLAMGNQIRRTRLENERIQKEKSHTYQELAKVFYPHQVLQIQQGHPVEKTMPVGKKQACVISFDIIRSSFIKHEKFSDLVEEFMGKCRSIMMEHYDDTTLSSTGYMIKEMGDGFLCSVGFPFKQTTDSPSLSAVLLGERIIEEFASTVIQLKSLEPVFCAAGIARGKVKAYFSKSGAIRHDLWGRGIVLATRYESVRKLIFNDLSLDLSNILILQEDVFNSLPHEKQQEFQTIDLTNSSIKVRDDPHAKRLAFRVFNNDQKARKAV